MREGSYRPLALSLCVMACAAAAVSLWPLGRDIRTDDKNRDGRPDVWRVYDRQGQLATMAVDTNFDGRSDVHEYYERGALVRRESDRDFNDRVDLVQEFDATTRQTVRSLSDVDFDGVADLLVLFQGGQPVYSEWAHGRTVALSGSSAQPSDVGASWRGPSTAAARGSVPRGPRDQDRFGWASAPATMWELATSGGLPECRRIAASPLASSSDLANASRSTPSSASVYHCSTRGPPVSHLLS